MVWYHVAKRTGPVVITASSTYTEILGYCDLNMIDVIPVPDRLENAVAEPKNKNVLNRLFSEIMVDPIDLVFFEYAE